nr:O-antigen ligase family protein [uncultured Ilyobacter sp.]
MQNRINLLEMITILLYNLMFLFQGYFNKILVISGGMLFFLFFILSKRKKYSITERLTILLCIYIPTSFTSVLATSYGSLPLTWFNLTLIMLYVLILFRKFKKSFYFFSPFVMIFYGLYSFLINEDLMDPFKQLMTIVLFLISFFVGEYLRKFSNKRFLEIINQYYILSIILYCISIIIQAFMYNRFGIRVGYFDIIGNNRIVMAGLMNDYSFGSLFIATGMIVYLIEYMEEKKISTYKFLFIEILMFFSILKVNSRTGLFAFLIISLFYFIYKRNFKSILILLCLFITIPFILNIVAKQRGGQALLSTSGRINLNKIAIENFANNILLGVGLGVGRWRMLNGVVLPHNLITQYLAQLGLIGSLIFHSNFVVLFIKYIRYKSLYLWPIIVTLIGAMAIPDIVSSRFLSVLVILAIISSKKFKVKYTKDGRYEKSRKINV